MIARNNNVIQHILKTPVVKLSLSYEVEQHFSRILLQITKWIKFTQGHLNVQTSIAWLKSSHSVLKRSILIFILQLCFILQEPPAPFEMHMRPWKVCETGTRSKALGKRKTDKLESRGTG